MKKPSVSELVGWVFDRITGKLRLDFAIDGLRHSVHAVFHDPPKLSEETWELCVGDLAMACLTDLATVCMAETISSRNYRPSLRGDKLFREVCQALRMEMLAERNLSLARLNFECAWKGEQQKSCARPLLPNANRVMLLMGGGKDSLYSYDLLRRAGYDVQCFYLTEARRTWHQLRKVYQKLEGQSVQHRVFLDVNRRTDLDRRYGQWYLSQFQIGQIIACAVPYALGHGCQYLALGLERSSDDPMYYHHSAPVNHQHQKSSGYLKQVNRYLEERFYGAVQIVSPVHGMYDLGIYARFMQRDREVVALQSSCGGSNYLSAHCCKCEKCGFLAALFVGIGGCEQIYRTLFRKDPLNNPQAMAPWLRGAVRPLTCAGQLGEFQLAWELVARRGWPTLQWPRTKNNTSVAVLKRELAKYLRIYPTPLMPVTMSRRVGRLLKEDGRIAISAIRNAARL